MSMTDLPPALQWHTCNRITSPEMEIWDGAISAEINFFQTWQAMMMKHIVHDRVIADILLDFFVLTLKALNF